LTWPALPFMDRVGLVFLACLALAITLSLLQGRRERLLKVEIKQIDYATSPAFNLAALAITAILIGIYWKWW
jgi:SSS family solute:Na+ symporter